MPWTILLPLLRKALPYILIALVVAVGYFHYMGLKNTIKEQQKEIAELKVEVQQKKDEIADLKSKLSDCQAANEQYQQAVEKISAAAEKMLELTKKQEQTLSTLRTMIGKERAEKSAVIAELKDLKSRPLAKTCEGAIEELVDGTKNFTPLHPSQGGQPPGVPNK